MSRPILAALVLTLVGGCAWFQPKPVGDAPTLRVNPIFGDDPLPAITEELLEMDAASAAARDDIDFAEPDREQLRELVGLEQQHGIRLRQIVQRHGWPSQRLVGAAASQAAWGILVRAEFQPILQAEILQAARDVVGTEIPPDAFAQLLDRTEVARGLPQTYGTQFRILARDGESFLQPTTPIADPAQLDARRAALGLVPHANYLAQLQLQATGRMPDNFVETAPSVSE